MPSTLSKPLGIRVPHAQLAVLEALAQERGQSRGALATEALCRGLELLQAEQLGGGASTSAKTQAASTELEAFARDVLEAARKSRTGRFGQDRVLINHVWKQFQRVHPASGLDEESFKLRLVEANRARLLSLVCADMAPVMKASDIEASETRYLSATFHFVCI
jgi:hypothetical protein